ncbi:MAG: glycosyltransferase family 4 protein [Verrucomicrobiota bacterium]|jgi:glycosyltransferase involved in cell wall biosynthesis
MKIAMVVPDNRDELRRYAEPDPFFGQAVTALLEGLAQMPDCEVHIVCCIQKPLRSPPKLAGNIYYHSVMVPKWGWMRGAYLGCIRAVRKKLREIKPDLVHGQGTERYCALAAVFSGYPNILTLHGNMRQLAKIGRARRFSFAWLAARLERVALPRSGGVICLSRHTHRLVAGLAPRTWILPNAVDGQFFERDPNPLPKPPLPKQILCVANILRPKNQVQLIRALDPLAQVEKFELIFFGNAVRGNAYVEEFFGLLEGRSWCRFAGFADRPGLRSALGRATLLVLPTLEDNCPMAVLEAMAAGVPVAASRVGGIPDLISDGVDGLLFDPEQTESMRAAVARILLNDEDAGRLAAAARSKALHCFDPQVIARRHLEIYGQIIGAR